MSIVIISADLDGLKHINDTFGHTEETTPLRPLEKRWSLVRYKVKSVPGSAAMNLPLPA